MVLTLVLKSKQTILFLLKQHTIWCPQSKEEAFGLQHSLPVCKDPNVKGPCVKSCSLKTCLNMLSSTRMSKWWGGGGVGERKRDRRGVWAHGLHTCCSSSCAFSVLGWETYYSTWLLNQENRDLSFKIYAPDTIYS